MVAPLIGALGAALLQGALVPIVQSVFTGIVRITVGTAIFGALNSRLQEITFQSYISLILTQIICIDIH